MNNHDNFPDGGLLKHKIEQAFIIPQKPLSLPEAIKTYLNSPEGKADIAKYVESDEFKAYNLAGADALTFNDKGELVNQDGELYCPAITKEDKETP